jgi:hypothetical protein
VVVADGNGDTGGALEEPRDIVEGGTLDASRSLRADEPQAAPPGGSPFAVDGARRERGRARFQETAAIRLHRVAMARAISSELQGRPSLRVWSRRW